MDNNDFVLTVFFIRNKSISPLKEKPSNKQSLGLPVLKISPNSHMYKFFLSYETRPESISMAGQSSIGDS